MKKRDECLCPCCNGGGRQAAPEPRGQHARKKAAASGTPGSEATAEDSGEVGGEECESSPSLQKPHLHPVVAWPFKEQADPVTQAAGETSTHSWQEVTLR